MVLTVKPEEEASRCVVRAEPLDAIHGRRVVLRLVDNGRWLVDDWRWVVRLRLDDVPDKTTDNPAYDSRSRIAPLGLRLGSLPTPVPSATVPLAGTGTLAAMPLGGCRRDERRPLEGVSARLAHHHRGHETENYRSV
jgi:hypothetical protein